MPRSTDRIQAEIDIIEAKLADSASMVRSVGADGSSVSAYERKDLETRLEYLYRALDRASGRAPMFRHGRIARLNR
jgi:hypothetical protein